MRKRAERDRKARTACPRQWTTAKAVLSRGHRWRRKGRSPKSANAAVQRRLPRSDYFSTVTPAVALAVADWLDTAGADLWAHGPLCECRSGCYECDDIAWQPHVRRALAVADAYLGTAP